MKAILVAAVASLLCATPASAVIRVFDYTARVYESYTTGPFPPGQGPTSPGVVPVGTMITGSFSYDDALVPVARYHEAGTYWVYY